MELGGVRPPGGSPQIFPLTFILSFPLCLDRGAGGGSGAARRIPPDVPPHIQQLLEQQERQALERGSPMRRPICRRVLASGGTEYGDGPGNVYIVPGVLNDYYRGLEK